MSQRLHSSGASQGRRLFNDVILEVEVDGKVVNVQSNPDPALTQMTLSQLGASAAPPAPRPPLPASLLTGEVPSGNDISYSQMGLIIGLVLGGLFLIFLLVLAYICLDYKREGKKQRRTARASGVVHSGGDAELNPEAEGSKIPGLPEGQTWTTVHDGIVGLELVDDGDGSEGSGGGGGNRMSRGQRQEGQSPAGGRSAGGGGGSGGGSAVLSVMRNAWESASASLCFWDWRTQVSAPLSPVVDQQQQQQQQPPCPRTPSCSGAAGGGAAARGDSPRPPTPGSPSPGRSLPPLSPPPRPPPPPPQSPQQPQARPHPHPPPKNRQQQQQGEQRPQQPQLLQERSLEQLPAQLLALPPLSPAPARPPLALSPLPLAMRGARSISSDGGGTAENLGIVLASLKLSALSNRSTGTGGIFSPTPPPVPAAAAAVADRPVAAGYVLSPTKPTVPAAAAASIPALSPRDPQSLETPYCAVRASARPVKPVKTPPRGPADGGYTVSMSMSVGVVDGRARAPMRRSLASGAGGSGLLDPKLGSLAMRPRWRI